MWLRNLRTRLAYWIAPWTQWHKFHLRVDKDGGAVALIDGEPIPVDEVASPPTS